VDLSVPFTVVSVEDHGMLVVAFLIIKAVCLSLFLVHLIMCSFHPLS